MSFKHRLLFVFLAIITLGLYVLFIIMRNTENENLKKQYKKVVVDIDELISNVGELSNVKELEFTHTKIKFILVDVTKVKIEEIKKQKGIFGLVVSNKSVSVIVGNSARVIASVIEEKIN